MAGEIKKPKQKSKEYPAVTFSKAFEFVDALKDYPMSKPISYGTAATQLKVSETTKSFKYALSAAKQFGLISTSGKAIVFLDPAKRFTRPTESELALDQLKMDCFSTPKIYSELIKEYKGNALPPIKTLENIFVTHHGVAPNVANSAAQTFIETATEVGALKNGILDLDVENDDLQNHDEDVIDNKTEQQDEFSKYQKNALEVETKEGFEAPLIIPFGNQRKAILYMPAETTKADAEYAKTMILSMFTQLYEIDHKE